MKRGHNQGPYKEARVSHKSRWLTAILTLFFAGLLYLILMAISFN